MKFYPSGDPLTSADVKCSLDRIFQTPGAGDLQSNSLQSAKSITRLGPSGQGRLHEHGREADAGNRTELFMFSQHFTGVIDSKIALAARHVQ